MKRIQSRMFPVIRPAAAPRWRGIVAALFATMLIGAACPVFAGPPPTDGQIFLDGFRSYQQGDYADSQAKLAEVVARFPKSPVRDMALYWLSRSCYRSGNQRDAARYLSQLFREFPHTPLKELVDDGMQRLVTRYERGESLPIALGAAPPEGERAG